MGAQNDISVIIGLLGVIWFMLWGLGLICGGVPGGRRVNNVILSLLSALGRGAIHVVGTILSDIGGWLRRL